MSRATAARLRLVNVNGPLQTLTATSAVLQLQEHEPLENVLVFNTHELGAHDAMLRAAVNCASAIDIQAVVDLAAGTDLSPLQRLTENGAEVADLVLLHNYTLHQRIIEACPGATVTVYGDAFGQMDIRRDAGVPTVDRIVAPLPQPRTAGSMKDIPWEAVRREHVLAAMTATRNALPELVAADRELAAFARGGVLALTSYFSCADLGTTPAGEATLIVELVRRSARAKSIPVLLKPHPRATLGVVSAAARALRRLGYPVRVWSDDLYGGYPIELFSDTLDAVDRVRSIASSATVSLAFIHGLRSDVELDPTLARRTIGLLNYRGFVVASRYYDELQRHVRAYSGKEPLPTWPDLAPPSWYRYVRMAARPLAWTQVTSVLPAREAQWPPEPSSELSVDDTVALLRWDLEAGSRSLAERLMAAVVRDGAVSDRIERTLEQMGGLGLRGFRLTAAVLPPTHLPAWRQAVSGRWRMPVVPGAALRAAQVEELVERRADVLEVEELKAGAIRVTGRIRPPPRRRRTAP
jgi:hypothetical protein